MSRIKPPSLNEIDYFKRMEVKRLRAAAQARAALRAEEEARTLQERHWMRCPKCGHDLSTVEMYSFEVETCGHCHGVWLDAGELEGILAHEDTPVHEHHEGLLSRILRAFRPHGADDAKPATAPPATRGDVSPAPPADPPTEG